MDLRILTVLLATATGAGNLVAAETPEREDLKSLITFADNLIEFARDVYGEKQTPLFVSQVAIRKRSIPPAETTLYGKGHRGGAGPTTNNLHFDSGLIRLFDALTRITGERKYSQAIDDYLAYFFEALPEPNTGFFPWGDHRGYDVVEDRAIRACHEFKVIYPPWERFWQVNPQAVRRQIESLKLHVYDESKSWAYSRHYPSGHEVPHSMPSSGGAWIVAWSFLYGQTNDDRYLQWTKQMADYFWSIRDPNTDLLASHPADPAYPGSQRGVAALRASRTEYMAQLTTFAPNLLIASRLLGPDRGAVLRRQALAYIRAFTTRMDIRKDGSFYPTFDLKTGKPLFPRIKDGWKFIPQTNERFTWANRVLGIRAPMTLAFACKMTGETDLRDAFDRLLPLYELDSFDENSSRRELPAGLIAQAIVSFLNMHEATGETHYLDHACTLGRYALKHYYRNGWFVCGPPLLDRYSAEKLDPWAVYSNRGGSAELALAILRLSLVARGEPDFVDDNPMCYF